MKAFHLLLFLCSAAFLLVINSCLGQSPIYYATTYFGGANKKGTIISFNPTTNQENVVWNFGNGNDGQYPWSDFVADATTGLMYCLTQYGGSNNTGAIISFNPATNEENVIWNFGNGIDGQLPWGNMILCPANGLYYAMTQEGGANNKGAIISFNTATGRDSVLWSFGGVNDAWYPISSFLYNATNGLLYATVNQGATNDTAMGGDGAIISFDPMTNIEEVLWDFAGSLFDGAHPGGNFVPGINNGLLYAMTFDGGTNHGGTIISFNPATNRDSVLWNLGNATDGAHPWGSLTPDSGNGLFYGLTYNGGQGGYGAIISFNPATNRDSVLWSFERGGSDGFQPIGSLVYDAADSLFYGTTGYGGSNGSYPYNGTIISFNPATNTEKVLWGFGGATDGSYPTGSFAAYIPRVSTAINSRSSTAVPLNIFPNPAEESFTITGIHNGEMIELYNFLGQKVSSVVAENVQQQLNISNLANGLYLLRVMDMNGNMAGEGKVVKE